MEIEFTKPTPEAAELQDLFNQTDKEAILCLTKELDKAQIKSESIPERVGHWVRESAEECRLRKQWEACADNLVDYAHEFVAHLSTWGKGYDRYDKDTKKAEDAIEEHKRLKNETTESLETLRQRKSDEPAWKSWNWPMYTPFTSKK